MTSEVAFDYECTGLNPRVSKVFGFVLTDSSGNSEVFDLDIPGRKGRLAKSALKSFWEDTSVEKIAHHLKFELSFTAAEGIKIPEGTILHDTMLMSQISDNLERSHGLDSLTNLYCSDLALKREWKYIDGQVKRQANARGSRYDRVDRSLMHKYQKHDGFRTMLLYKLFKPLIQPYWENYRYEVELARVTQRMEDFGLKPSLPNIKSLSEWLEGEIDTTFQSLFPLMNSFQNFNSDAIVRKFLYEMKQYPVLSLTETGEPSVDKDAFFTLLEKFPQDKPELDLILKYRSYIKGLSMIEGYKEAIEPDGIIHHNINTNSARTGRQSASNPNMQNVAKENAMKSIFPVPARRCFIPRDDSVLLFVDYSGIEMRLIIEAVKEPTMIEVLRSGGDVHSLASEYWFGDLYTDIDTCLASYLPTNETLFTEFKSRARKMHNKSREFQELREETFLQCRKILRSAGKNSQFALAYGADFETIRSAANIAESILRPGFDAYVKRFPLIANFTRDSMQMAKKQGFVMTSFGRRLNIERYRIHTAANYRIQGTAAEMLKRSTVLLDSWLQKNFPEIRIIVPIHDELMIHCPKKYIRILPELLSLMGKEMTKFPTLAIPIEVEWEVSSETWNDKMPFAKWYKKYAS